MIHAEILKPVVVLVLWSLVMLVWLVRMRMAGLKKAGIDLTKAVGGGQNAFDGVVDERVQWPAHNYMHLMEQPTLFYAVALLIAIEGGGDGYSAVAAWIYVGLRIVHSLVQALYNRIIVRFALFAASTLALVALAVQGARLAF